MNLDNNKNAFLALVRTGLWEKEVRLSPFNVINYDEIYRLAQEQSVSGLVAAGLEHVVDTNIPQEVALEFAGEALQLEQRNTAMNLFINVIVKKLKGVGIYTILVKGQGIAQCYERPLWRACGDIDFFISEENYHKSVSLLVSIASSVDEEIPCYSHLALTVNGWKVELHGSLRGGLWKKVDQILDDIQKEIFYRGRIRYWMNGNTLIYLPHADEDVVYVFSHVLQHFFRGGIGLRQICDWCRLLWSCKDTINQVVLEKRLKAMGLMSEWKTFSALAVFTLGMPKESIPFYSSNKKWKKKAQRVLDFILETGNFGHNRDSSYYEKYPYVLSKMISLCKNTKDTITHLRIFPIDSIRIWGLMIRDGICAVFKGK